MSKSCSSHQTILSRDPLYSRWVFRKVDSISPIGISYSKMFSLVNSPEYKRFEKSDKIRRRSQLNKINGQLGTSMVELVRYKKSLLGHGNMKIIDPITRPYFYEESITPLLKWPGGKSLDLKHIREQYSDLLPTQIRNYYEPFGGGMAVALMMNVDNIFVNDLCADLINFYEHIKNGDEEFYDIMKSVTNTWNKLSKIASTHTNTLYTADDETIKSFLTPFKRELETGLFAPEYTETFIKTLSHSLLSKIKNIRRVEIKRGVVLPAADILPNIEGALKAAFYTFIRDVYNSHKRMDALRACCFYFLREYSFSSMFRYNADGGFNVPFGGLSYNDKSPDGRVKHWKSEVVMSHMNRTRFDCADFLAFLRMHTPSSRDFIFLDPPYDSEFSTYDQNTFGETEQKRLAEYLLTECKANFMAIMKATPFIKSLYEGKNPNVKCKYFDKNYAVSFMDRNERGVQHIIATRINQ